MCSEHTDAAVFVLFVVVERYSDIAVNSDIAVQCC